MKSIKAAIISVSVSATIMTAPAKATVFDFSFTSDIANGSGSYEIELPANGERSYATNMSLTFSVFGQLPMMARNTFFEIYNNYDTGVTGYYLQAFDNEFNRISIDDYIVSYSGYHALSLMVYNYESLRDERTADFSFTTTARGVATPGPIAGAGIPALLVLGGLFGFRRWRSRDTVAA